MPIYEYQCDSCGHRFEKKQRFHDDPLAECPECQGGVRRLIHPAPIIFKGSGFYVTDSRGVEDHSEAKPEAKPESKPDGGDKTTAVSDATTAPESGGGAQDPGDA